MPEAGRYLCVETCQPRHLRQFEYQRGEGERRRAEWAKWERSQAASKAKQAAETMARALRPEIDRRVQRAFGSEDLRAYPDSSARLIISVDQDLVGRVTFDALDRLRLAFDTRDINLKWERGFGGSDVTPGTPDSIEIVISGWTLPDETETA